MSAYKSAKEAMEDHGLYEWQTGGGMTGFGHEYTDGSTVLLTGIHGDRPPAKLSSKTLVGWEDRDGNVVLQVIFPSLTAALAALEHGPETIPADLLPGDRLVWTEATFWAVERIKG